MPAAAELSELCELMELRELLVLLALESELSELLLELCDDGTDGPVPDEPPPKVSDSPPQPMSRADAMASI